MAQLSKYIIGACDRPSLQHGRRPPPERSGGAARVAGVLSTSEVRLIAHYYCI